MYCTVHLLFHVVEIFYLCPAQHVNPVFLRFDLLDLILGLSGFLILSSCVCILEYCQNLVLYKQFSE